MKVQKSLTEKLLMMAGRGRMYGMLLLLFVMLCMGSTYMYEKSDDWTRTLGHNYDLFGNNKKIQVLYLGTADGESETEETAEKKSCDLRSKGQSLEESYFLLKRADRRYALLYVHLTVDSEKVNVNDRESEDRSAENLRKIIAYCRDREIELILHAPTA